MNIILPLLLALCLTAGCGGRSGMHCRLAAVDSIVDRHYDSALVVLQGMDTLPMRRSDRMYLELLRAKAMNKASVPFTTDSVMRQVVRYYDRRGSRNRRLLAHYLLGCTYRDLGSAPRALEEYQRAVAQADTTRADCDLATLMRVHSQMTEIYTFLRLYEYAEKEAQLAERVSWTTKDTLSALLFGQQTLQSLYSRAEYKECIRKGQILYQQYEKYGHKDYGALLGHIFFKSSIELQEYDEAKRYLDIYESCPFFRTDPRKIRGGYGSLLLNKGEYWACVGNGDSAYYYFHEALNYRNLWNNALLAYKGLYKTFELKHQPDSTYKYMELYSREKEKGYEESTAQATIQTEAMFNYNIEHEQAMVQERKASRSRFILYITVLTVIALSAIVYIIWYRREQENEKELNEMKFSIQASRLEYSKKEREVDDLKKIIERHTASLQKMEEQSRTFSRERKASERTRTSYEKRLAVLDKEINQKTKANEDLKKKKFEAEEKLSQEKGRVRILTQKEGENRKHIETLEKQIRQKERQLEAKTIELTQLRRLKKSDKLENESIVDTFYNAATNPDVEPISASQWRELRAAVECHFPRFYDTVFKKNKLTKEEYRMCLLIKTGRFRPKDIEILLGWKTNFASKKRQQLFKKIFKADGSASDFDQRIKELV